MSADAPRALRVSVTELLAVCWPALFGLAGLGGRERLGIGRALHADHQAAAQRADPSYRAELSLAIDLCVDGWSVHLGGRADGVRETGSGFEIEELKSLPAEGAPCPAAREAAARQAALYAWMLAGREGQPVRAVVLWLPLAPGEEPERQPVAWETRATESFARDALRLRVREAEAVRRERATRRTAAPALGFPHAAPRPGQVEIATAVAHACAEGEQLLVEAPTGLGKTAAVLHPALRFALAEDLRVVMLTARGTQQRGVLATHALFDAGAAAPAVRLRAKSALCLNDAPLCHEALCRYAREHRRRVAEGDLVTRALATGAAAERSALLALARGAGVCPHALALQASGRAALIVGDFNHLLEPAAALDAFAPGGDARDVVLVLDEAHQLLERARESASPALEAGAIARALEATRLGGAPVHRELADALAALLHWLEETVSEQGGVGADFVAEHAPERSRVEALRARLDAAWAARLRYGLATGGIDAADPAGGAWSALARFEAALDARDVEIVPIVERRAGQARLAALCPDPAPRLRARLGGCRAVIAQSATLSPAALHQQALGFDPRRAAALAVPSPFPDAHRCVVIDPRIGTRLRERGPAAGRIARRLAALARAVPGHVLALLPSFAFLHAVERELGGALPRVVCQPRRAGEAEREALLEALAAPAEQRSLVLGVAGGILAEGVDYPGDALRAVAVIGPCLPPPDPLRELARRRLDEQGSDGFEQAYALPGMVRVVQAAGRVVRSERDRGLVALYGRRFLEPPYRELLPAAWLRGEPPEARVGDPARMARDFFAG